MDADELGARTERALAGNLERGAAKLAAQNKLFVRDRIALLTDQGSFVEDGLLANTLAEDLPADGVVTGTGQIDGRPVCVVANDPTVKAGSWGARTVEKMIRTTEYALRQRPADLLARRLGRRPHHRPGRAVPRTTGGRAHLLQPDPPVGTGAAGLLPVRAERSRWGLHPELLRRRLHGRGQCLDVPRVAPDGRDGDRRADHARGDGRGTDARHGLGLRRQPGRRRRGRASIRRRPTSPTSPAGGASHRPSTPPWHRPGCWMRRWCRPTSRWPSTCTRSSTRIVDAESFFEIKPLFAPELITGFGRIDGRSVGIVANDPSTKGGVLFTDSADKAARFIWLCDAFNIPLLFLADVPGFMVGTQVERQGIIRHGAKMVTAVTEATVPKLSVIVRKAYGAGLYAMSGPAFDPEATIALPDGQDRRDGSRGRRQRGVRQQDRRDRRPGRSRGLRCRAAPHLRPTTSTSPASRPR